MPGTLKLLKTLCRQAPVMAFMALATSGLATDARASDWKPEETADVTFNSDSGRESLRAKILVTAPEKKGIDITFDSKSGHDSNAYCNHRAWIVDWQVTGNDGLNAPIVIESQDLDHDGENYIVPVTLCKRGIGNTFKIVWTLKSGTTFDSGPDHCTSTSCYTEVTIHGDDPPVATLVLAPAAIDESGSTNTSTVTATLDKAAGENVTINISASPDSPAVDGDFTLSQKTALTILAGKRTSTGAVTITAVDNQVDAQDKTITVSATASGAGVEVPKSKTLTINDDDAAPTGITLTVDTTSIAEDASATTITVTASVDGTSRYDADKTVQVTVGGTGSTATSGTDYALVSSISITIPAGAASATGTFNLEPTDDTDDEGDETISVVGTSGNITITPATITVNDNDGTATLSLSGPADADEGASGTSDKYFTVSLSGTPSRFVTWQLCFAGTATIDASAGGTIAAGADYQPISGQTPINLSGRNPKCTSRSFSRPFDSLQNTDVGIRIKGDTDPESAETVTVTLSIDDGPADVVLGTSVATYTILNDDVTSQPTASFASGSSSAAESAGTRNVKVNLSSAAPSGGLTLGYSVSGTATAGSGNDFTIQNSGTLSVAAGETSATIPVAIIDDSVKENAETVILTLARGTGYTLGTTTVHTLTITDNDPPPGTPALVLPKNALSVTEGGTGSYTVKLATEPADTVTVNIASDNGDVTVSPVSLTFHAGGGSKPWSTAQTVTVSAAPDNDTADDSATLTLTATGGDYGSVTGSVTVAVDDQTPVASFATPASSEEEDLGTETYNIVINLNPAPPLAITLRYGVTGTATAGSGNDFTIQDSGTLHVEPGDSSVSIPVTIIDDSVQDDGETVILTLAEGNGYTVGAPDTHTLTIRNDNDHPRLPATSPSQATDTGGGVPSGTDGDRSPSFGDATVAAQTYVRSVQVAPLTLPAATGGDGTLTYTLTPDLPAGLEVDLGTRKLAGTPTATRPEATYVWTATDEDGDTATLAFTIAVAEIPAVSVAGGGAVTEGGTATFTVRADPAPATALTVRLDVSEEGVFLASPGMGERTVTFAAGEGVATLHVATADDAIDEPDGTVLAAVVAGEGYVAGTEASARVAVSDNDDPEPTAVGNTLRPAPFLTRLGRTVAAQALDGIAARMAAQDGPGLTGTFAGQALPEARANGRAMAAAPAPEARIDRELGSVMDEIQRFLDRFHAEESDFGTSVTTMSAEETVAGTAFALTPVAGGGIPAAFWGRGARSGFGGTDSGMTLDGEVTGFMLGADGTFGGRFLGLMLSRSRGEGAHGLAGGEIETGLTALIPYGALDVSDRIRAWGAAGLGLGDMTLTWPGGGPVSADLRWRMAAAGLVGEIGTASILGDADLRWTADALWTRTSSDAGPGLLAASGETTRLRFGLDGTWTRTLASGATLVRRLETGLRHDGGDAETGLGLEVGGGVDWSDPARGLAARLEGRTLAMHEDGAFEDWGLALSLSYDPRPETRRGLSASFGGSLGGAPSGGAAAFLDRDVFPDASDGDGGEAWNAEMAYGTGLGAGMVGSSYGRVRGGNLGARDGLRLGYRIGPDASHAADVSADVWAEPETDGDGNAVGAGLEWKW